jgi:hypothetical protein
MNVCADKNRCAWPRSHRGDRFERFRTSKQTGRNPPQAAIASLGYTPERHHGETLNPVSFGWVLGT